MKGLRKEDDENLLEKDPIGTFHTRVERSSWCISSTQLIAADHTGVVPKGKATPCVLRD